MSFFKFHPVNPGVEETTSRWPWAWFHCTVWLLLAVGWLPVDAQSLQGRYPAVIESSSGGVNSRIDVLGQRFAQAPNVAADQSRIVLYRLEDGRSGATSVFVNGRYHTSLVPGAWSQLCHRSGPVELATRQMHTTVRAARDGFDQASSLALTPGQAHYLRVDMNTGLPVLTPVAAAQARQELGSTREQLHTVSRAAQACNEVMTAPAPLAQPYILSADTLFAFDRSDRAGLTDDGIEAIERLIDALQQDFSRIDQVHLSGHADPLGSVQRNEQLAVERAQTVREYMVKRGRLQAPITAAGMGSRQPVVRHCGQRATPQAIACNQPNRRVSVEVQGQRR